MAAMETHAQATPVYANLLRFLSNITFPNLVTLHLQGWFDMSDVSTIAQLSMQELARDQLHLFCLLGYLRGTTAVEVRLENSQSHPNQVQCGFSGGEGEWESRSA